MVGVFKRKPKVEPVEPAGPGNWQPADGLWFRSKVGDQPTFFVPDTGTPGGSATLIAPDGTATEVTTPPVLSLRVNRDGTPHVSRWGPRVGFKVPYEFAVDGVYKFVITQDDVVTTYRIRVTP